MERQNLETMNPRNAIEPETPFLVSWIPDQFCFSQQKPYAEKSHG